MDDCLNWSSVPFWLLALWLLAETACRLWLRRQRAVGVSWPAWCTLLRWGLRPWGFWSVFSIVWRWNADTSYDHNLRTFPFFANLWQPRASVGGRLTALLLEPETYLWGGLSLGLIGLLAWLAYRLARRDEPRRAGVWRQLLLIYLAGFALLLVSACLPDGPRSRHPGVPGSLTRSWTAHGTVLYAMPRIKSASRFLHDFVEIQPSLRNTIHGLSHPPGGALSLYFIGRLAGVPPMADIRSEPVRLRYLLGLAAFGLLNVFAVYGLARAVRRATRWSAGSVAVGNGANHADLCHL
ncbi:MAG: hypothetical protein PHR35_15500 [Kiritimatiellae bacterium]|nr:hypothetical protein [Kiritimatiellia bacterium]